MNNMKSFIRLSLSCFRRHLTWVNTNYQLLKFPDSISQITPLIPYQEITSQGYQFNM